jgi:hypothetical protein
MTTKNKIGKYLVRYSLSSSKSLIEQTFQHLEMQGGLDSRLSIARIASVQKTCGIDPKVLGSVVLVRYGRYVCPAHDMGEVNQSQTCISPGSLFSD